MSKLIVFVQVQGHPGVLEAEMPATATLGQLHDALAAAGVKPDGDSFVFIDDAEDPVAGDRQDPAPGLKHGGRVFVSRWKRITTTVHFLEKTAEREFPPGVRVRAVKEWAVHKFEMSAKDAAEHVLQLCQSSDRPSSDTPLAQLANGCAVCFDLVPDQRVEG